MGALLVGLVTTSAAYLLALVASIVVLAVYQVMDTRLLIVVALFAAASGAVPAAILWYTKASASSRAQARLAQVPGVGPVLHAIATAPAGLLRDPGLLAHTIAATLLLRGLTVWLPMLPGLWCARWVLKAKPVMPATP